MHKLASLDKFDRLILKIVQRDSSISHQAIGDMVNLSASSVRRRLKRMKADGLIQKEVALLNPNKTGVTLITSIRIADETVDAYEQFDAFIASDPFIKMAYHVAGEDDYVLIVHSPTLKWYEDWCKTELMSNSIVERCSTVVVWSQKKLDTAIEI